MVPALRYNHEVVLQFLVVNDLSRNRAFRKQILRNVLFLEGYVRVLRFLEECHVENVYLLTVAQGQDVNDVCPSGTQHPTAGIQCMSGCKHIIH